MLSVIKRERKFDQVVLTQSKKKIMYKDRQEKLGLNKKKSEMLEDWQTAFIYKSSQKDQKNPEHFPQVSITRGSRP